MERINRYLQKSAMSEMNAGAAEPVKSGIGNSLKTLGTTLAAGVGLKFGAGKFSKGIATGIDNVTKKVASPAGQDVIKTGVNTFKDHPIVKNITDAYNKFTATPAANDFTKKSTRVSPRADKYVAKSTAKMQATPPAPIVKQDVGATAQPGGKSTRVKANTFQRVKA